jgi:hypothetical protein
MSTLREARWVGCVAHIGEMRNAYRVLDGKPEGKRSYGTPTCRWKDGTECVLKE